MISIDHTHFLHIGQGKSVTSEVVARRLITTLNPIFDNRPEVIKFSGTWPTSICLHEQKRRKHGVYAQIRKSSDQKGLYETRCLLELDTEVVSVCILG